ncbi:Endoribonuclease Dicer, partial [Stegodyphus mimosarum]
MKKKCPSFAFLKPEFIAGHGRADLIETAMSLSKQKKILSRFRKKKCNLLIATSILEEGVDIQQCNLVIRFDLPSDFCSYIQSKGRARAKNSMYILMVPQHPATVSEFLQNMSDFKTIEKVLLVRCHNRVMPSEEEISDHMADSLIPAFMPYGPQGPRITMSSSIALINRYCARHHQTSDISTKSEPQWDIKVVDPDSNEIQYVCMLHLQINSYLKQTIIGENMKQKRLAKMSAALKACKLLYEIGELNEHLMPVTCSVDKALVEELGLIKNNIDEILPEKNRRRQLYEKHMPIFLKNSRPASGIPCYLHIFKMDLTEPLPKCLNPLNRPLFNPMATSRNVALLTSKIWPPVNPFPLFTKSGKILVKVKALKNTIILSSEELKKVEEFHKFVFSDALWLDKNKGFSPACSKFSAYIVPVNKVETANYDIDWSFIDATKAHPYNDQKHKTLAVDRTHFDEELFKDSVLIRFYKIAEWKNACPSFHHVINILYSMSPESKLDESSGITFKDYYKAKYNIRILNDKQPLVETVRSGVGNFWKPLYISLKDTYKDVPQVRRSKQNQKHHNEYLVPELCIIHPFPSSFFNKVIYLPTMLFRLQCLLLAEEIRQNVASEACVGSLHLKHIWPEFNLEKSDKVLKEKLHKKGQIKAYVASNAFVPRDVIKTHEKIISFEAKVELLDHPGPNPSLILQALTSKSTADEFDSECLKKIGNSFLRYVLSVKTYHKYPNYDAGKLSKLRSGLTKTSSLCHAAKKKNLAEYLICTCFNYNTTWLPPCYIVNEVMSQKSSSKKARRKKNSNENTIVIHQYFTKQLISDDCIADTVKALIGVYLLSCGQQGALQFMNWLGLNPLTKNVDISDKDFISWPPVTPDPLITSEMSSEFLQQRLSHLTSGFDRFEDIIKYKFNNVAYLLQAFTHCSYSYNEITDCYQKLRFLGSTVLDYIITRQLFEDCNDHFSEILSDHRSTLISDEFFASLAVRYKYHEFLKMLSPWYFKLLNCYLELLQKSDAFKFFEKYGYYQEVNCSELERDKVPQVLVDVFESVAGAIYLDSGSSLDIVWKIYYPMIVSTMSFLKEHIQSYT